VGKKERDHVTPGLAERARTVRKRTSQPTLESCSNQTPNRVKKENDTTFTRGRVEFTPDQMPTAPLGRRGGRVQTETCSSSTRRRASGTKPMSEMRGKALQQKIPTREQKALGRRLTSRGFPVTLARDLRRSLGIQGGGMPILGGITKRGSHRATGAVDLLVGMGDALQHELHNHQPCWAQSFRKKSTWFF